MADFIFDYFNCITAKINFNYFNYFMTNLKAAPSLKSKQYSEAKFISEVNFIFRGQKIVSFLKYAIFTKKPKSFIKIFLLN